MSKQIQEPLEDSFKHQKEGVLLNVAAMMRDLGQIKALLESGLFNMNGRPVQSGSFNVAHQCYPLNLKIDVILYSDSAVVPIRRFASS